MAGRERVRVLRFPNGRIENRDWEVIGEILRTVESRQDAARLNDPSSDLFRRPPSPTRGEG
jgi:hypothetical protein